MRLDAVRQQIARDYPDDDINVTFDNDTAFVRGTVKDVTGADRVMAIASSLGQSGQPAARRSASGGAADPAEGALLPTWTAAPARTWASTSRQAPSTRPRRSAPDSSAVRLPAPRASPFPMRSTFCCSAKTSTLRPIHPGAGKQEPAGDAGRTESAGDQRDKKPASWRAASFPSRWYSPAPPADVITIAFQRVRHPSQFPAAGDTARDHPAAG